MSPERSALRAQWWGALGAIAAAAISVPGAVIVVLQAHRAEADAASARASALQAEKMAGAAQVAASSSLRIAKGTEDLSDQAAISAREADLQRKAIERATELQFHEAKSREAEAKRADEPLLIFKSSHFVYSANQHTTAYINFDVRNPNNLHDVEMWGSFAYNDPTNLRAPRDPECSDKTVHWNHVKAPTVGAIIVTADDVVSSDLFSEINSGQKTFLYIGKICYSGRPIRLCIRRQSDSVDQLC